MVRTVFGIRSIRLALVLVAVSLVVRAQDWRDDDSIWGFGSIGGPQRDGPRPAEVPSIAPQAWIGVTVADGDFALLAFPWILDAERAAPRAGENGWGAQLAPPLAPAACAFTTVVSEADEVRMALLTGARGSS